MAVTKPVGTAGTSVTAVVKVKFTFEQTMMARGGVEVQLYSFFGMRHCVAGLVVRGVSRETECLRFHWLLTASLYRVKGLQTGQCPCRDAISVLLGIINRVAWTYPRSFAVNIILCPFLIIKPTRCANLGTAVAQWLRCCATIRKVAGSIPDGVIGIFH